jgi:sugar O-acyltransferase (sialic acid O-acetyltransferase NeuD family)
LSKIVIYGNSQIGELAEFYFRTDSHHEVVAFAADSEFLRNDEFCGLPVINYNEICEKYPPQDYKVFVAYSYKKMNHLRAEKFYSVKKKGYTLVSYVSSRCTYLSDKPIGENCFILEDNTIQPFVKIGNNITLWSGNHIGHDSQISDHCYITSHVVVSGHVHIKPFCFIGVNVSLRDNITIAAESLVGAGAVIMNDTEEKGVYLPPKATKIDKISSEIDL